MCTGKSNQQMTSGCRRLQRVEIMFEFEIPQGQERLKWKIRGAYVTCLPKTVIKSQEVISCVVSRVLYFTPKNVIPFRGFPSLSLLISLVRASVRCLPLRWLLVVFSNIQQLPCKTYLFKSNECVWMFVCRINLTYFLLTC